jgi:DNA-binding TFAR19-related protein (PDSD5 family)
LNKFFGNRAWEVFDAAKAQYPSQAVQVEKTLVKLIKDGKVKEMITGEELYVLFRRLGMRVKLETHIRILEDGKIKSIEEKIREETSQ